MIMTVTFTGFLVGIFNRVPFPNGAPLELTKASSIPSLKVIHCRNKAFRNSHPVQTTISRLLGGEDYHSSLQGSINLLGFLLWPFTRILRCFSVLLFGQKYSGNKAAINDENSHTPKKNTCPILLLINAKKLL